MKLPCANKESGFSLLSTIVAVGIVGIIIAAVSQVLTNSINTQAHINQLEELRQLRTIVERKMSCSKTITKTILSSCLTSSTYLKNFSNAGNFFKLNDKTGKQIGVDGPDGSIQFGKWAVKARCIKTKLLGTIQIGVAKFNDNGGFATDPLTKKTLSWEPLYKPGSPLADNLCTEELAGITETVEAEHLVSKELDVDTKTKGCGKGLLQSILGGKSSLYKGTVFCPSDKRAVAGGTECMPGSGSGNLLTFIGGSPKGLMVASRPASDGQGWYVECCLDSGGILGGIGGKTPAPKAYVVCLDKNVVEPKSD